MYRTWLVAIALALAASACSSSEKKQPTPQAPPTQAEIAAAIADANPADTDGDGLPDEVEKKYQSALGTDWQKADTDGDGVNDGVEVLGASWLWVATHGQSGAVPGPELAGNANDAAVVSQADSDGDGVSDYLEVFGYDYDIEAGRFVAKANGYHTDPLQWSSDQDAYSDGQEVSGINMDVAVRWPGTHPLVPAYPDIQVDLTGYSLALTDTVTYGEGGSIARETNWSRTVEKSHSLAEEVGLEIKVGGGIGKDGVSFSGEVTTSVKVTNTDTTTVSTASGGSVTDEANWSTATTSTPAEAAAMKLHVKVRNRGTAPASNIVPTLSLRIGGADVATFEPPSLSVANLLPGAAFPPDGNVSWVIDSVAADRKLFLTDWELRALESRAPVSLGVAQKRADVMRLEDGKWVSVGDAGEYLARIVSTSADIFADVGAGPDGIEGNLFHVRVAANDSASSPIVTLGDALAWSMGFRQDGDHYAVDYPEDDGTVTKVPLTGKVSDTGIVLDDGSWRWQFDALTLALNGYLDPDSLDFDKILALRLYPGSRIGLRAPRRRDESAPIIYTAWATSSRTDAHVVVCASDYDGIAKVWIPGADGTPVELNPDGRGPYFYSRAVPFALPASGTKVWVESTRTQAGTNEPLRASRELRVLYELEPKPAVIEAMTLNLGAGSTVTALSIKAWSPTGGIKSVKLFDNTVTTGAFNPVQNLFENPNGWVWSTTAALPVYDPNQPNKLRIVVETTEGLYTVKSLSENQDYAPLKAGSFGMGAQFDWTWTDEWWITIADLDFGAQPRMAGYYIEQDYWGNPDNLLAQWKATVAPGVGEPWPIATQGLADFYFILPSCNALLGFFEEAMPAPGLYEAYYAGVNRRTIVDAYNAGQFTKGWLKNGKAQQPAWGFAYGSVFFFKTPEGRFGKLLITDASGFRDGWTETCGVGFHASYAIYNAP
ncbi:MAG: binary toxin-like calcium binding domain-containing protein [Anaeromyxobacter sp.]